MGVAPRRLFGWEPAEFTEYVYEGEKLVGSVTRREAEFDAGQVALLLAHRRLQADRGPHGIPMSDAVKAENQYRFKVSPVPTVDHAAKALADTQKAFYAKYDRPGEPADRAGHLWSVTLPDLPTE